MGLNPNCEGTHCHGATGEVRRLPSGGDSAVLLCRDCFYYEMAWRAGENRYLPEDDWFAIHKWEELKVYEGG